MKLKKLLSLLLAVTMLFSCVGITAMAEETAPTVTTTLELKTALANGGTVKLGNDIVVKATDEGVEDVYLYLETGEHAVLDLNGYELTNENTGIETESAYILIGGNLKITDSSDAKSGKLTGIGKGGISAESICTENGWTAAPVITITGGTVKNLYLAADTGIDIQDGTVELAFYDEDYFHYDEKEYNSYVESLVFLSDPTGYVPEDFYMVKNSDGTWGLSLEEPTPAVAEINGTPYATLADALAAVKNGDTIVLQKDCDEVVTFTQTKDVSFILDGNGKTYSGSINITARAGKDAESTLIIQNFNFKTTKDTHDFIKSVETNYYPNNIAVKNCSFEGPGADSTVVAIRVKSSNNMTIEDCTGTGLHSFLQNTAGWNTTVKNVAITNSGAGLAMGTMQNAQIENLNANCGEFGVRFDARGIANNSATIKNCTITADMPIVMRKVDTNAYTLTMDGENNLTANQGYWCVVSKNSPGSVDEAESPENHNITVTLNDTGLSKSGVFGLAAPVTYTTYIGDQGYETLADALVAAKSMTGDVTVDIYDKVTLSQPFTGSYDSIKFVGKEEDAEIYLDFQGYIDATGENVAFEDLKLSKVAGEFVDNAGFMNLAFGINSATSVTYTNCTFLNGAYASKGTNTFTNCTFYRSHDRYGLWAYGAETVVVEGCTFADIRGIKLWAEGNLKTTDLTVKNTDFSAVTDKPAIVLASGKSVALENNTYSSKGVFELDLDHVPNGTKVTSDKPEEITCVNDNGECGVLVNGKIYTTVAQAAEVATEGSKVTLLHNSAETVEFDEGVILDKNKFTAAGVTVKEPAAVAEINGTPYATLADALENAQPGDEITLLCDVETTDIIFIGKSVTINGGGHTITSSANRVIRVTTGNIDVVINNLNLVSKAVRTGQNEIRGISLDGNLSGVKLTLNNCSVDFTDASAHDWAYAVNVTANNTNAVLTINGGSYEGANVINIYSGSNNTINVDGATLTSLYQANDMYYGLCIKDYLGTNTNITVKNTTFASAEGGHSKAIEIANGSVAEENNTDNTTLYVAKVGGNFYYSIEDAIAAANEGDTVTIISNVADEAVEVNKKLTITGNVTANNVSINAVEGCSELTVENISFTGNSWINSGAADKLTVEGVTANVTPSNAAQTNSRSAFISLGRSEQKTLELTVKDCNIVSAGGSNPVLGWAAVTKVTMTGNTFGSAEAYQTNSDSVKFMAIADGAEFSITGNTIYSNYNGLVFGQNTTRNNAYTVNIDGNTFLGGADHIWIEITGGNTVNATILATSNNTVNGNKFTKDDIKAHTGVIKNWTSFAGVDVVTNADGKVIGGSIAFYAADAIAEGYKVDETGLVVEDITYVAEVNGVQYATLQEAIAAANAGDTVKLLADIEQVDGVLINDKNIEIDLNSYTYKVTKGDNTNSRAILVKGSSEVTIKNGTIIAAGDINSGTYGTVRTEGTSNVALTGLKLYSYRGAGLNVKVCPGTTVTVSDTEIYAQYGGGIEANGGTVILNEGVKIEQSGIYDGYDWCSVAIGVNYGGKVVVNSGSYSAAPISTDSNAAKGSWVAYVMNSGGTLEINGGTFNGIISETAVAANACGIICADTSAVVNIKGGKFISNGAILDVRNNAGGVNPSVTLEGGTYSADPADSGLYGDNLIKYAEGYVAIKNLDGSYVVGAKPSATVNNLGMQTVPAKEYTIWNGSFIEGTEPMPLSFVMQFIADQTAADMATSPYADWYADFVLTFEGLEKDSFKANGCYLAGYYGSFGWVKVPVDGMTIEEGARYPVMLGVGLGQKYNYVCSGVQDFKCALYITPEILAANPNLKVNLELAVVDSSKGGDAATEALVKNENTYKVTDYNYEAKDFVVKELFDIYASTVNLGNSLAMKFAINKSDIEDVDYYAEIKHDTDAGEKVIQIPFESWVDDGDYYIVTYSGIFAKQIGDDINITIKKNGTPVSNTRADGLKKYALKKMERLYNKGSLSEAEKESMTVLADMLNYGAAAQKRFEYKTDKLATDGVDEKYLAYATQETPELTDISKKDESKYYGATLSLKENIVYKAAFIGVTDGMKAVVSFTKHSEEVPTEKTIEYKDMEHDNEYSIVKVDNLVIADANQIITITIYNSDGTEYTVLKDSMNSYFKRGTEHSSRILEMAAKFTASAYNTLH